MLFAGANIFLIGVFCSLSYLLNQAFSEKVLERNEVSELLKISVLNDMYHDGTLGHVLMAEHLGLESAPQERRTIFKKIWRIS